MRSSSYSDEATRVKDNGHVSTNDIIEDTRSSQEELNNGISRDVTGIATC